jgi:hypothetical protein
MSSVSWLENLSDALEKAGSDRRPALAYIWAPG